MTNQNIIVSSMKYVLIDLVGDVVRFPLWWYTAGVKQAAVFCWKKIKETERALGIKIWLVNLFKPMFGQRDWQGRIISFFMRLIQLVVRSALMIIYVVLMVGVFLLWLIIPIMVVYKIIQILFK